MLNYVRKSETETVTPNSFFAFPAQVAHHLTAVNILIKSIAWKFFCANALKCIQKSTGQAAGKPD